MCSCLWMKWGRAARRPGAEVPEEVAIALLRQTSGLTLGAVKVGSSITFRWNRQVIGESQTRTGSLSLQSVDCRHHSEEQIFGEVKGSGLGDPRQSTRALLMPLKVQLTLRQAISADVF